MEMSVMAGWAANVEGLTSLSGLLDSSSLSFLFLFESFLLLRFFRFFFLGRLRGQRSVKMRKA
jgi:hypothetical protein